MNFGLYNYYRYLTSLCASLAARTETVTAAEPYRQRRHQDAGPPRSGPADIISRDPKARPGLQLRIKADVGLFIYC